ncbi:fasciclin domain-containing protein [Dinghuibacter silviterrae]|uniref:Putative surface protein with fasciclin (FAS1) repeats n=1 Tax=Dinghuibacter silviterrae TaxID=1539049 RepID=A0A4R8DHN8_9BACT|nr:fasciclin domain-containing protein [Dinghuibacter silviterrae]TDW97239.1 putative surface protein with fasciclin (FAS1) repeats [Dinghuibacter silviterrae]
MNRYILLSCLLLGVACRKATDYLIQPSHQMHNSAGNLVQVLDSSDCHLFDQAFHRVGLDTTLKTNGGYTIFAPSDSAMTAAGLTSQAIAALPIDSLAQIVRYHVVAGAYSDAALTSAEVSVQAASLRADISLDTLLGDVVYQQNLYIKENGVVYINGEAAGNGMPAVAAFNGYLFTLRKVLAAPRQSLWQIISSDPRLSLYCAALRIDDSLYNAYEKTSPSYPYFNVHYSDSLFFATVNIANPSNSYPENPNLPTVFAPTDSAFRAAGFNSVDDIRQYALSAPIGTGGPTPNNYTQLVDIPMDSILYAHVIYNANNASPAGYLALYNDLQFSPLVNHGLQNTNSFQILESNFYLFYYQPYPLVFSVQNGVPYIQWNPAISPVPLSPDTDPTHPKHFMARNGALYIIDQLFTSPN